jgi:hypothetical protein
MQQNKLWLHTHCLTLQQKHATKTCSKKYCICMRVAAHCSKNMQQNTAAARALPHIAAKTCS